MKIMLLSTGKTRFDYLQEGIADYTTRLQRYIRFEHCEMPAVKHSETLPEAELKKKEAEAQFARITERDVIVLLDENGKQMRSTQFAAFIDEKALQRNQRIVFLIGGAYGFHESVYARANHKLSLSQFTFSHQLIRLIFLEQLYRAFTILRGEKYHHQ